MPKTREKIDPHKGVLLGVYIDAQLKERIRREAARRKVTMSEMLVKLLEERYGR